MEVKLLARFQLVLNSVFLSSRLVFQRASQTNYLSVAGGAREDIRLIHAFPKDISMKVKRPKPRSG